VSTSTSTTTARRWPHFSLRQLLVATAVCALAATALAVGSSVWVKTVTTLMLGLVGVAVVAAILLRPGGWRGFWLGYAILAGLFALPVLFEWEQIRGRLLPFELERLAGWITTLPPSPYGAGGGTMGVYGGGMMGSGVHPGGGFFGGYPGGMSGLAAGTGSGAAGSNTPGGPPLSVALAQQKAVADYQIAMERYQNQVLILRTYATLLMGLLGGASGAWIASRSRTETVSHN
jgi:hypothetical protein